MSDKVLVESQDHILTITFNRPEKYNALDPESSIFLPKLCISYKPIQICAWVLFRPMAIISPLD